MRLSLRAWFAVIFVLCLETVFAEEPMKESASSSALVAVQEPTLNFPAEIGGMKMTQQTDYEKDNPGAGVGWSYRGAVARADVYIYSMGFEVVPSNLDSPTIAGHFQQTVGGVYEMKRLGHYADVKTVVPEEKVLIGPLPFLHAELRFTEKNQNRISHLYLGVWKGRFLKIRLTYLLSEETEGKRALAEFLQVIGKLLSASENQEGRPS